MMRSIIEFALDEWNKTIIDLLHPFATVKGDLRVWHTDTTNDNVWGRSLEFHLHTLVMVGRKPIQ